MEKTGRELPAADSAITLPAEDSIKESLERFDALHSVKNHFFPSLLKLAGQEMSGAELTVKLAEAIDDYAKTKDSRLRDNAVRRLVEKLPDYLRIFMAEGQELDDTLELLRQTLASKRVESPAAEESEGSGDNEPAGRRGAPRGIKRIIDMPEHQRTHSQKKQLQKWLRQLGGHGLNGRQPNQRELAQRQAERERDRFKES